MRSSTNAECMQSKRVIQAFCAALLMILLGFGTSVDASSNGKENNTSGCGCHSGGSGGATPTHNFPSEYNPGQLYSISIGMTSSISGSGGGFSLTTSKGSFSNAGSNAKIVSGSATHSNQNARAWTVDWTAPTTGSGSVNIALAVLAASGTNGNSNDGWGTTTHSISEAVAENQPPIVSNIAITPTLPKTSDELTLTYTYSDSDSDTESGSLIRWTKDGSAVSEFNDLKNIPSSATSKGESWSVSVTPSDGTDFGSEVAASNPVIVINSIPIIDGASISPSDPVEGEELTLSYTFSDADDGDSPTLSNTRWYVDNARISSLDGETSVPAGPGVRAGDVWYAEVLATDGEENSEWFTTNSITVNSTNTAPTMTSVSFNPAGPFATSDDITVIWSSNDVDAGDSEESVEIRWKLNGVEYPSVTSATLESSNTAKEQSWVVECRVSDGEAWSDWRPSEETVIVNTAPVLETFSIEQDSITTEDIITLNYTGTDIDNDVLSLEVVWYLNGNLVGPVVPSVFTSGDVIEVEAQLDDNGGLSNMINDSITVSNAAPRIISASFDEQVGQVSSTGLPTSLAPLAVNMTSFDYLDPDELGGSDSVTITWTWYKNGFRVSELDNQTSVPVERLAVGQVWKVEITPSDGIDTGEVTSLETTIGNVEPLAEFTTSADPPVADSITTLNASLSNDPDDEIDGWFWQIGTETLTGEIVTVIIPEGSTTINLTVLDSNGGSDSIERTLNLESPNAVTDVSISSKGSDIELSWSWSGSETTFYIYRSSTPINSTEQLTEMTPIESTTETSYSEPILIEGEMYYAVTVEIRGVESPTLTVESNSGSIMIDNLGEIVSDEHPAVLDMEWLYILLSVLILLASVGLAFMDKMKGSGE